MVVPRGEVCIGSVDNRAELADHVVGIVRPQFVRPPQVESAVQAVEQKWVRIEFRRLHGQQGFGDAQCGGDGVGGFGPQGPSDDSRPAVGVLDAAGVTQELPCILNGVSSALVESTRARPPCPAVKHPTTLATVPKLVSVKVGESSPAFPESVRLWSPDVAVPGSLACLVTGLDLGGSVSLLPTGCLPYLSPLLMDCRSSSGSKGGLFVSFQSLRMGQASDSDRPQSLCR